MSRELEGKCEVLKGLVEKMKLSFGQEEVDQVNHEVSQITAAVLAHYQTIHNLTNDTTLFEELMQKILAAPTTLEFIKQTEKDFARELDSLTTMISDKVVEPALKDQEDADEATLKARFVIEKKAKSFNFNEIITDLLMTQVQTHANSVFESMVAVADLIVDEKIGLRASSLIDEIQNEVLARVDEVEVEEAVGEPPVLAPRPVKEQTPPPAPPRTMAPNVDEVDLEGVVVEPPILAPRPEQGHIPPPAPPRTKAPNVDEAEAEEVVLIAPKPVKEDIPPPAPPRAKPPNTQTSESKPSPTPPRPKPTVREPTRTKTIDSKSKQPPPLPPTSTKPAPPKIIPRTISPEPVPAPPKIIPRTLSPEPAPVEVNTTNTEIEQEPTKKSTLMSDLNKMLSEPPKKFPSRQPVVEEPELQENMEHGESQEDLAISGDESKPKPPPRYIERSVTPSNEIPPPVPIRGSSTSIASQPHPSQNHISGNDIIEPLKSPQPSKKPKKSGLKGLFGFKSKTKTSNKSGDLKEDEQISQENITETSLSENIERKSTSVSPPRPLPNRSRSTAPPEEEGEGDIEIVVEEKQQQQQQPPPIIQPKPKVPLPPKRKSSNHEQDLERNVASPPLPQKPKPTVSSPKPVPSPKPIEQDQPPSNEPEQQQQQPDINQEQQEESQPTPKKKNYGQQHGGALGALAAAVTGGLKQPLHHHEEINEERPKSEHIPLRPRPPVPVKSRPSTSIENIDSSGDVIAKKSGGDDKLIEKNAINWLNTHLHTKQIIITDIFDGCLNDGLILLYALEDATNESVGKYTKKCILPVQRIDNLTVALNFLGRNGVDTKGWLDARDIVDGDRGKVLRLFKEVVKVFGE